jgi:hypothetical protein
MSYPLTCVSMVAALKLEDLLPDGVGTREAQYAHAGLHSGVDKAHHLNAGDGLNHLLCQHVLRGAGSAKAGALLELLGQGCNDLERREASLKAGFVEMRINGLGFITGAKEARGAKSDAL